MSDDDREDVRRIANALDWIVVLLFLIMISQCVSAATDPSDGDLEKLTHAVESLKGKP